MQEEKPVEQTAAAAAVEETPIVVTQKEIAKEVKAQVRKTTPKAKTRQRAKSASATGTEKVIKSESNPPRADKKYIEKGDLLVPVE